jgi:Leucine-rich repeat (LRR) protein
MDFYLSTNGQNWRTHTNWLVFGQPMDTWYGITLDTQGRVSVINLSANNLQGTLPTQTLGNLTNLLTLNLRYNQLSGNFPSFSAPNLINLYLNNNQFTGSVPFFTYPNLQLADLGHNSFSGSLPPFKLPNLKGLTVDSTHIDSLPNLSSLTNLTTFKADTNKLTFDDLLPNLSTGITYTKLDSIYKDTTIFKNVGESLTIHLGIDGALTTNLYLWYQGNRLAARTTINQLTLNNLQFSDAGIYTCQVTNPNLPTLTLYSRKITLNVTCPVVLDTTASATLCPGQTYTSPAGRVYSNAGTYVDSLVFNSPTFPCRIIRYTITIRNNPICPCLDSLALVALYNATNGAGWTRPWNLSQPMTTWTDLMFNAQGCVEEVLLENNNLIGTLPIELGNLANLVTLRLSNNKITGNIPTEMGKLSNLWELDLSGNQLTNLPISIGNLNNLRILNVSSNPFNSTIPTALGTLKRIRYLILSNNGWRNTIPDSLGNLTTLQELHLSNNQLTGNIPNTFGNLTNLQRFFIQNNQLSGATPVFLLNLNALTHFNFQSNRFDQILNFTGLSRLVNCAADSNRLTFETILPNIGARFTMSYANQDSIFKDTTYFRNAADALTIDLNIDNTVSTNVYKWFKNNILYKTTTINKLIFNFIRSSDAGSYRCEVTNPNAPLLTLYSRKALVKVNCPIPPQRDTTICQGQLYMAQGRPIGATVGTFFDTLQASTFCDSVLLKIAVHARDSIELPMRDTCDATGTATQTRRFQNRFGCDSIVIQRFTLAAPTQKTVTIWSCNASDRVRDTTLHYRTIHGCDSAITQQYRFCRPDSTIIRHTVCHSRPDSILLNHNFCGCDSVVKHRFTAPNVDTMLKTELVCDILHEGTTVDVTLHVNPPFCDSLVRITNRVFDRCDCLKDSTIIYNGLIPNDNDNKNDYFILPLVEQYQPNELIVTDKRGMLVYRKQNYKNDWSGTNQKGEPLPEGIYNFVFRTVNPNCIRMGVIDIKYIP